MKKRILNIIALLVITASGCSLKEDPKFSLNEITVFSNVDGAQLALNGVYAGVSSAWVAGQFMYEVAEMSSGLSYTDKAAWRGELAGLNVLPTNILLKFVWERGFLAIKNANNFIAAVEASPLTEEVKINFIGQAKFIRSFVYLQFTGLWGGLPLRNSKTNSDNTHIQRASRSEVYDQIEEDLLEVIESLEPSSNHGQVNEWAARALLAKTYFLRASQEDETNGTQSAYWQLAKVQGDLVINSGVYALDMSFINLWDGLTPTTESLFEFEYGFGGSSNGFVVNGLSKATAPNGSNNGFVFSRTRASKTALDFHMDKYPGDPRIDVTFFHTSFNNVTNGTTPALYPAITNSNVAGWPYYKKYFDPNQVVSESAEDAIMLRYADLLLLMAEVENELGNSGLAQSYVNTVLSRARTADGANATEPADWPLLSKEDFRKRIFYERQIELMGEGKNFVEVRRRGVAWFQDILQRHNDNPNNEPERDPRWSDYIYDLSQTNLEKNLLLPLPSVELNFNELMSEVDQNPGY